MGFLLTGGAFEFSINALEPNTYDGLLFVTVYERDGPPDCNRREVGVFRTDFFRRLQSGSQS